MLLHDVWTASVSFPCLHAGCMRQLPPQTMDADCHVLCVVTAGLPTGQHGYECQRNTVEEVHRSMKEAAGKR